ncbi:hypothetical protein HHK36_023517 [Tetracentron sinense]|uniref:non-specific serine/threonine protein kinase n=1 Tax=Tetracentron sinense TaxID=13715 RepID=A0A834YQA4_TETSI|nr:hypothetical protein HHK36_023517 [Tetracentron sinense]
MMEKKGTILLQRYELGRLLGQGTFAKVYHARHLKSGQSVAIKIIDKEKVLRVGMIDQIKREISVMRIVRHPNVVQLYEVMASKNKIYFAMEYAKGGELFDKVAKGKLKEDTARKYFQQLIGAIDFCHSRGVYHRDLKPENLLLDENGNLKVSDFGLSALWESRGKDGLLHTTCGTPAYVAPEVISNKGYDGAKADIWSCGVVLFVIMAGYLPFHDCNLMEMYRKISKGDFKCPHWFLPDLRKLLLRILDPNLCTRITVAKLMENSWFKKGFKQVETPPPQQEEHIQTSFASDFEGSSEKKADQATNSMKPTCMNAFDIISLSPGFDLSGLFEKDIDQKPEARFTTTKPASAIVSKLEEIAEMERFKVKKKDGMVMLQGSKEGRKGQLSIDAEIFEVTPSFHVVEVKKTAGDTLEYQKFCNQDLKPSLKDIIWTWQGVKIRALTLLRALALALFKFALSFSHSPSALRGSLVILVLVLCPSLSIFCSPGDGLLFDGTYGVESIFEGKLALSYGASALHSAASQSWPDRWWSLALVCVFTKPSGNWLELEKLVDDFLPRDERSRLIPLDINKGLIVVKKLSTVRGLSVCDLWLLSGRGALIMNRWWLNVNANHSSVLNACFWLQIHGLPLHLWLPTTFFRIGKACGGLLRVDECTSSLSDLRVARIHVVETYLDSIPRSLKIPDALPMGKSAGDVLSLEDIPRKGAAIEKLSSPLVSLGLGRVSRPAVLSQLSPQSVDPFGLYPIIERMGLLAKGQAKHLLQESISAEGSTRLGRKATSDSWCALSSSVGSFVVKRVEDSWWFHSSARSLGSMGSILSRSYLGSVAKALSGVRASSASSSGCDLKDPQGMSLALDTLAAPSLAIESPWQSSAPSGGLKALECFAGVSPALAGEMEGSTASTMVSREDRLNFSFVSASSASGGAVSLVPAVEALFLLPSLRGDLPPNVIVDSSHCVDAG